MKGGGFHHEVEFSKGGGGPLLFLDFKGRGGVTLSKCIILTLFGKSLRRKGRFRPPEPPSGSANAQDLMMIDFYFEKKNLELDKVVEL